jgi:hypothetical protein
MASLKSLKTTFLVWSFEPAQDSLQIYWADVLEALSRFEPTEARALDSSFMWVTLNESVLTQAATRRIGLEHRNALHLRLFPLLPARVREGVYTLEQGRLTIESLPGHAIREHLARIFEKLVTVHAIDVKPALQPEDDFLSELRAMDRRTEMRTGDIRREEALVTAEEQARWAIDRSF